MSKYSRIKILPDSEIIDLYARPSFNLQEQKVYFSFSADELEISNTYGNVKTRIYFMLQMGYFKAKQQIFKFSFEEVKNDLKFLWEKFFKDHDTFKPIGSLSRDYLRKQKKGILEFFKYSEWFAKENEIKLHIARLFQLHPKVRNVYHELLTYLEYE